MTIQEMYKNGRYTDFFILTRFFYRIGRDIINDGQYTKLEDYIKKHNLATEYINRTYDDDPIPFDLLKEIGRLDLAPNMKATSKYSSYLDEEKSLSIEAKRTVDEVFEFIQNINGEDIAVSLKTDGVNGKSLFIKDYHELSLSRARAGEGFDYTKNIANAIPCKLNTGLDEVKVFSETLVLEKYLPVLQKIDPSQYKTPKSSAISLLRRTHAPQHYKYMITLAFALEGVPSIKTAKDRFDFLREQGFKVVPNILIKNSSIPKDKEMFGEWLYKLCDKFYTDTKGIKSDGLVFEVNNLEWESTVTGQYSNRNIAVKLFHWDSKKYKGIVEEIVVEQQRCLASCRIKIKPMLTDDLCTATYINAYNPDIIISQGINVGTKVTFERDSGAINKLIYTDKMNAF